MALAEKVLQEILFPDNEFTKTCPVLFFRDGMSEDKPEDRLILDEWRWHTTLENGKLIPHPGSPIDRAANKATAQPAPNRPHYDDENGCLVVPEGTTADLSCYFNMCSAAKWLELTCVQNLTLSVEVSGEGTIDLWSYRLDDFESYKQLDKFQRNLHEGLKDDSLETAQINSVSFSCEEPTTLRIPVGHPNVTLVGFSLTAKQPIRLYGGAWLASLDDEDIVDVNLCISTTTFQKEEYILRNVEMMKNMVATDADMADHFQMLVVDNGRTLDAASIEDDHVHVFGNDNTGGSGGFARGMIEALRLEKKPTHIILMDDDVYFLDANIKRAYTLLSLLKPRYRHHFLSGAMLRLDDPEIQHEDIGFINEPGGYYAPKRGVHHLSTVIDCASNEVNWLPFTHEYAAWWYCCIPMEYVTDHTLPFPFFVRGDDVEYALRVHARVISMNGIGVWHMGFTKRFVASMEYYQVIRNSFILRAFSKDREGINMMGRCNELVTSTLGEFSYDYADLVLDALEDYLKGPALLEKPNGIDIIREKGKKNEKLVPLDEVWTGTQDLAPLFDPRLQKRPDTVLRRKMVTYSHNGQRKLQNMVKDSLGFTPHDMEYVQETVFMKERVLVVNAFDGTGAMHERNPERYEQVLARRDALFERYENEHERVEAEWRAAHPRMTSIEFWTEYLGLEEQ